MNNLCYVVNQERFREIESWPLTSYWISDNTLNAFHSLKISDKARCCKGLDTCDNGKYTRLWYEVEDNKISFVVTNKTFKNKWALYAKGGDYRKWYGNIEYVVLWENNGAELKNLRTEDGKLKSRPQNVKHYFQDGLTFNGISSKYRAIRVMQNAIFGGGGNGVFSRDFNQDLIIAALINSKVSSMLFKILNPGLNFLVGDMMRIPLKEECVSTMTMKISKDNVVLSKSDWDSFETSWDFKKHPLI